MHLRAPKLLEDIRSAADFVKTATDGVALPQFKQDRLLRQAVERNFEIIGEAMRRLEKDDPDTAARITDYRRIIAFRNVLIPAVRPPHLPAELLSLAVSPGGGHLTA
ncbi:MAG: DUF86 domain-containing protein [Burkholderiaceae bacterium]|nr:DUF86 domain-containing protein [Burkholderiaceae bacterium]